MFSLGRKIALANAGVMKRFQNASNYDPNGSKTTAGGRTFPFIARKASVEQVIKGSLLVISTDDAPSTPDGFGNADGMVVYGVEARYVDDMLVRFLGLYTALDDAIRDIDVFNEDMRGKVLVSMDGLTHVLTPVPDGSLSDAVQEDIQKKSEDGQAQKRQKTIHYMCRKTMRLCGGRERIYTSVLPKARSWWGAPRLVSPAWSSGKILSTKTPQSTSRRSCPW
jgi:hypothetical protein